MLDASFFVSDQLHERTVKLADGGEHKLHFRELPAVSFRAFQIAETSDDPDVRAGSMARLIAASVCNPDGTAAMDATKAQSLKPHVMNALVAEILSLNRLGADAKKASPPAGSDGSGTSSPSPSAAEQ
jgi:hypothetical protein